MRQETMQMMMIEGQLFRVPQIKDSRDIRRFYGEPARQSAETPKPEGARGPDGKNDEAKEDGAKDGTPVKQQSSLWRVLRMKDGRFADALGAALLFGVVAMRFSGWRRPQRSKKLSKRQAEKK